MVSFGNYVVDCSGNGQVTVGCITEFILTGQGAVNI